MIITMNAKPQISRRIPGTKTASSIVVVVGGSLLVLVDVGDGWIIVTVIDGTVVTADISHSFVLFSVKMGMRIKPNI